MVLTINGVDFVPFLAPGGYECSREDRDGENEMVTLSGAELRDRLAVKKIIRVDCRPLNNVDAAAALKAIEPEYVSVTHTDPAENGLATRVMSVRSAPAKRLTGRSDGTEWWRGISFELRER